MNKLFASGASGENFGDLETIDRTDLIAIVNALEVVSQVRANVEQFGMTDAIIGFYGEEYDQLYTEGTFAGLSAEEATEGLGDLITAFKGKLNKFMNKLRTNIQRSDMKTAKHYLVRKEMEQRVKDIAVEVKDNSTAIAATPELALNLMTMKDTKAIELYFTAINTVIKMKAGKGEEKAKKAIHNPSKGITAEATASAKLKVDINITELFTPVSKQVKKGSAWVTQFNQYVSLTAPMGDKFDAINKSLDALDDSLYDVEAKINKAKNREDYGKAVDMYDSIVNQYNVVVRLYNGCQHLRDKLREDAYKIGKALRKLKVK